MKLSEASLVLGEVFIAYPSLRLTDEFVKVWHKFFIDEDPRLFQLAVMQACKSKPSFFPTVGEVEELLVDLRATARPLIPEEAFSLALKIAGEAGLLVSKKNEASKRYNLEANPALKRTLNCSDLYIRLYRLIPKKSPWSTPASTWEHDSTRKEFMRTYKEMLDAEKLKSRTENLLKQAQLEYSKPDNRLAIAG